MSDYLHLTGELKPYRLLFSCHDDPHAVHLAKFLQENVKHEDNLWKILEAGQAHSVLIHLTIGEVPGVSQADRIDHNGVLRYIVGYLLGAAKECDLMIMRSYGRWGSRDPETKVHLITYQLISWPVNSVLAFGYPADGLPREFLA